MNKKTVPILVVLSVLLSFIPTTSLAGSWNGWIYQAPYPTGVDLGDVKFISPMKGWMVGKYGSIFHTADGGETWEAQESGTEDHLLKVFFVNEKAGWVAGMQGSIIRTEDGGKTWKTQYNINALPTKILFVNELEGWLTGTTQTGGVVYHSRNGGKTWEKPNIGIRRAVSGVFFINPQTGWIMAGEDVYRTKDGGGKWEMSKLPVGKMRRWRPPSYPGERPTNELEEGLGPEWYYGGITFANEKQGWAAVYHWIFHTEDGGQTWVLQFDTGSTNHSLGKIEFRDATHGCAVGWSIVCTDDGGKTWSERLGLAPKDDVGLGGVSLIGHTDGWTAGRAGQIYRTVDGGRSWKITLQSNKCGSEPFFVNKKTGWLYNRRAVNIICRTDDGGNTWENQGIGIKVKSVFFIDDKIGWAVGMIEEWKNGMDTNYSGDRISALSVIKHTVDGGKTWETQHSKSMNEQGFTDLLFISFLNQNAGWIVGGKGAILHTEDGGKHWTHQKSGNMKSTLIRVQFVDAKVGWITGVQFGDRWKGIILHTKDSGKNWKVQHTVEDMAFYELYFINKKSGWMSGHSESGEVGVLLHTEDEGMTWSKKEFDNIHNNNIAFLDNQRGAIFSANNGIVHITTDIGKTWHRKRIPLRKYPWHFSEVFEKPAVDAK